MIRHNKTLREHTRRVQILTAIDIVIRGFNSGYYLKIRLSD